MMGSQAYGIRLLLVLYFYTGVLMPLQATDLENSYMEIEMTTNLNFCDNATLLCKVQPAESITWWSIASENVTEDERHVIEFIEDGDMGILKLTIICISFDDTGNYTCHASHTWEQEEQTKVALLDLSVPASVNEIKPVRVKIDEQATLICNFTGYPLYNIKWAKVGDTLPIEMSSAEHKLNDTFVMSVLQFDSVGRKDNGTYHCGAVGAQGPLSKDVLLFVRATPQVNIDFVTAVGAHRIFLNWTVSDGNEPIEEYYIQHMKKGTNQWTYYQEQIGSGNSSYIVKNLEPNSTYMLRLSAKNAIGMSNVYSYPDPVQTLDIDPDFVPVISVKGVTSNSITIGWCQPPTSLKVHVHYYQLILQINGTKEEAIQPASPMNLYLFVDLEPATTYHFKQINY